MKRAAKDLLKSVSIRLYGLYVEYDMEAYDINHLERIEKLDIQLAMVLPHLRRKKAPAEPARPKAAIN